MTTDAADLLSQPIVMISRAEQALMEAHDIIDIMDVRDKCRAIEAMIGVIDASHDIQQRATIIRIKAERKAGSWLSENIEPGNPQWSQRVTLGDIGISKNQSSRWQTFAKLEDEKLDSWIDEHYAKGWDISAAGLLRYAQNSKAKKTGNPHSVAYALNPRPRTCALKGYEVRCSGPITGGHIVHKGEVRGNAEARKILAACPGEIMAYQCYKHNVDRWANHRAAKRILLHQKIFEYGWPHMAEWWAHFLSTFKVPPHELRLEVLLDVS